MTGLTDYGAELAVFDKLAEDLDHAVRAACRDKDADSQRGAALALEDMGKVIALAQFREIHDRAVVAIENARKRLGGNDEPPAPMAWLPPGF